MKSWRDKSLFWMVMLALAGHPSNSAAGTATGPCRIPEAVVKQGRDHWNGIETVTRQIIVLTVPAVMAAASVVAGGLAGGALAIVTSDASISQIGIGGVSSKGSAVSSGRLVAGVALGTLAGAAVGAGVTAMAAGLGTAANMIMHKKGLQPVTGAFWAWNQACSKDEPAIIHLDERADDQPHAKYAVVDEEAQLAPATPGRETAD